MNKNQLNQSFDQIRPTEQQKERMLSHLLAQVETTHKIASPKNSQSKVIPLKFKTGPWMAAASLIVVLGLGLSLQVLTPTTPNSPQNNILSLPSNESSTGMRKFMNYNGHRYVFLETIPNSKLQATDLVKELGTLSSQITYDETSDPTQPFASTFAVGGTIWELSSYHPNYRVVVAFDNQYYLCENVGRSDDQIFDLQKFFEDAKFDERVDQIQITSRTSDTPITLLTPEESVPLLELISNSQFLTPSAIDFQTLFSESIQQEALTLNVHLNDQTQLELFASPSQKIIGIGDNYYHMSDALTTRIETFIP